MKKKVAKIILVNKKGELLFQLRDFDLKIPYPGYWGLLGGEIEKKKIH